MIWKKAERFLKPGRMIGENNKKTKWQNHLVKIFKRQKNGGQKNIYGCSLLHGEHSMFLSLVFLSLFFGSSQLNISATVDPSTLNIVGTVHPWSSMHP